MSFLLQINEKSRRAGRFISKVHRELQKAFVESNLKQSEVATRLGLDRGIVNRRLQGKENLTLRTVADMAWALDREIVFYLKPLVEGQRNFHVHAHPHGVSVVHVEAPRYDNVKVSTDVTIRQLADA